MNAHVRANVTTISVSAKRAVYSQAALMVIALLFVAACGGGGSSASNTGVKTVTSTASNYLTVTHDEYGLLTPNFFYSTDNVVFWSIQADVAKDVFDDFFKCIIRIDIPKTANGGMPAIIGKTFSIEDGSQYEKFPGEFFVFDGHESVYKKVEQGTISFMPASAASCSVTGTFDVIMTDYDSMLIPQPKYRLAGAFSFIMDTYGPANPLPAEVYPALGQETYDQHCASCHPLGKYNSTMTIASDLSMRGGELPITYDAAASYHQSIPLTEQSTEVLRIFLNAL
jgi:hypothetical protein